MSLYYEDAGLRLFHGSNKDVLPTFPAESYDSIITDPPYELGFMGKGWDSSGIAYDVEVWRECFRVLKPGGFLLAFGGTRTWHRIAVAIEDAGFEIRDSIAWMYGSGFPKSMNVAKAIEAHQTQGGSSSRMLKAAELAGDGAEYTAVGKNNGIMGATVLTERKTFTPSTDDAQVWEGWGTALKPAFEPIIVARKPPAGTVAANVLEHGTGALNIDACRVSGAKPATTRGASAKASSMAAPLGGQGRIEDDGLGRFPSNVLLDESQAAALDEQTGVLTSGKMLAGTKPKGERKTYGQDAAAGYATTRDTPGDSGGASRFFPTFRYEAKAPGSERPEVDGVAHATVKPLDLMRWLVRLVTRPGGRVLDLFAGSGTTGEAALLEGMEVDLIELEADHLPLILQRVRKPLQPSLFGDLEAS